MARAGRPLRSRASLSVRAEAEQKQDTPSTPSTPDVAQKKTDDELPPWVRLLDPMIKQIEHTYMSHTFSYR